MEVVKKRGWTKWGGGRLNLIKEHTDIWHCQACSEEQSRECPAYMFPFGENWLRICAECESKVFRIRIVSFQDLKRVNHHGQWVDNTE